MIKLQRFLDGFGAIYNAIYFRFDLQDNIDRCAFSMKSILDGTICTTLMMIGRLLNVMKNKVVSDLQERHKYAVNFIAKNRITQTK